VTALTDFSGEPRESRPSAHDHDQIHVPRPIIWLTLALILFTIAAVSIGRIYDIGFTREGALAETRAVSFRFRAPPIGETPIAIVATRADGSSVVLAKENEETFPRLILRSFSNIRMREGVDPDTPIQLIETADGQRLLVDPATHRTMRLAAFGPENQEMFDPVFESGPEKGPAI
tara:strand:- start:817 stop:1341 length:525 start_codon:yes stop_codon:yes gene_type:complete